MKLGASRLEDRLGPLEPPYRSRGEAQVGRLLDRYGLPFFYEQPTLVLDRGRHRIWHPDFSLLHYNGMVIEYAGMPDVPHYMAGIRHKEQVYKANAIPALFVYPHDLTGSQWPQRIHAKINEVHRQAAEAWYSGVGATLGSHQATQYQP